MAASGTPVRGSKTAEATAALVGLGYSQTEAAAALKGLDVENLPIVVIKRDSSRQQFDRNKILNGMLRACEKRPVPLAELERATDEIEQAIQNSLDREISTEKIGELVMERLKPLDEVAYVRFASVYRQFKDIASFMRELNKILEER